MSDINLKPSIHVFAFVENCWIRLQSVECLANTVASSTSIHLSNAIQNRKHNYDDQQYVPKFGSAAVDYRFSSSVLDSLDNRLYDFPFVRCILVGLCPQYYICLE
eukprot:498511_1